MKWTLKRNKEFWEKIFQKRCEDCNKSFDIEELTFFKKGEKIVWDSTVIKGRKEKVILEIIKDFWLCSNCYETWEPKFSKAIKCKRGFSVFYSSKGCKVFVYEEGKPMKSYFIERKEINQNL